MNSQTHDFAAPREERLYIEQEEDKSPGIKSVPSGWCVISREIGEGGNKAKSEWEDLCSHASRLPTEK